MAEGDLSMPRRRSRRLADRDGPPTSLLWLPELVGVDSEPHDLNGNVSLWGYRTVRNNTHDEDPRVEWLDQSFSSSLWVGSVPWVGRFECASSDIVIKYIIGVARYFILPPVSARKGSEISPTIYIGAERKPTKWLPIPWVPCHTEAT